MNVRCEKDPAGDYASRTYVAKTIFLVSAKGLSTTVYRLVVRARMCAQRTYARGWRSYVCEPFFFRYGVISERCSAFPPCIEEIGNATAHQLRTSAAQRTAGLCLHSFRSAAALCTCVAAGTAAADYVCASHSPLQYVHDATPSDSPDIVCDSFRDCNSTQNTSNSNSPPRLQLRDTATLYVQRRDDCNSATTATLHLCRGRHCCCRPRLRITFATAICP